MPSAACPISLEPRVARGPGLEHLAPCASTSAPTMPASTSSSTSSTGSATHGHEPVDHGAVRLRRPRRLPGVLPAGGRGAWPPTPGSLGVVIGGSGNGEQIAANKVQGVRAALVWSEETAVLARAAQRRQRDLGRRPDAHRRRDDPLRRAVPGHRRSPARSATCAGSRCSPTTSRPATCRRCPAARRAGPRDRCLRATPSTGSPPRSPTPSPATRCG